MQLPPHPAPRRLVIHTSGTMTGWCRIAWLWLPLCAMWFAARGTCRADEALEMGAVIPASFTTIEPAWTRSWRTANVGESFRARMNRLLSELPVNLRSGLARRGWRIELAEFVVDAAPELRGVRPRGWPAGSTWENADAAHLPNLKLLIVAEKRHTRAGHEVENRRIEGTFRHELGHAFDMAAAEFLKERSAHLDRPGVIPGPSTTYLSSTPSFMQALEHDRQRLAERERSVLHYYLQSNHAGRQETLAEAFACLLGGGSDSDKQAHFSAAFPETLEFVRQAIADFDR